MHHLCPHPLGAELDDKTALASTVAEWVARTKAKIVASWGPTTRPPSWRLMSAAWTATPDKDDVRGVVPAVACLDSYVWR